LLVEQVMASEGVASWVTIPLHRLGRIVGLLSLSSLEPDAFAAKDVSFFEQLGLVVEERLVELMLSQL
jgi:putative methionine-R-sulfoxide reductase with GAF domain